MTTVTGRLKYGAHTDAAGCKLLIAPARRMKGASWVTVPDKATPVTLGADGSFTVELEGGVWAFTEVIGAATHTERLVVPGSGSARYENLVPGSPTPDPTGGSYNLSIGTVTTGDAGTAAAATLTGQPPSQVLNLTIPRGVNGDGAVIQAGTGLTISGAGTAASPLVIAQADTGWRDILSLLVNGWTAEKLYWRRLGGMVMILARNLNGTAATDNTATSLIPGSSPIAGLSVAYYIQMPSTLGKDSISFAAVPIWANNTAAQLRFLPRTDFTGSDTNRYFSWPTAAPWPDTLPGTPA